MDTDELVCPEATLCSTLREEEMKYPAPLTTMGSRSFLVHSRSTLPHDFTIFKPNM